MADVDVTVTSQSVDVTLPADQTVEPEANTQVEVVPNTTTVEVTTDVTVEIVVGSGGVDGSDGADGASINPRGSWGTSTGYVTLDLVENNGSSYVATSDHTSGASTEPGVGGSWTTVWQLSASKGDTGATGSTGATGATGPAGSNGSDGNDGADGNSIEPVGSWTTSTAYTELDLATNNGSSYVCSLAHTSSASDEPGVGGSWATYWQLSAEKGDTGATGSTGSNGADGDDGGLPFVFSTTTSDSDPGSGVVRFNSGTPGSVTQIYIDDQVEGGEDVQGWLRTFDDSDSTITGVLHVCSRSDTARGFVYNVTGLTEATGYFKVDVAHLVSMGSLFSDTAELAVRFFRTGDKGTTGATGATGATGSAGANGVGFQAGDLTPSMLTSKSGWLLCDGTASAGYTCTNYPDLVEALRDASATAGESALQVVPTSVSVDSTSSTTDEVTRAAGSPADDELIWCPANWFASAPANDFYAAWVVNRTSTTFQISDTQGGSAIALATEASPDGIRTGFYTPDLRGRVVAGDDGSASRLSSTYFGADSGFTGDNVGEFGGSESHTLDTSEMPAHTHSQSIRNTSNNKSGGSQPNATAATTSTTTGSAGGGGAHNNVQPTMIANWFIKT